MFKYNIDVSRYVAFNLCLMIRHTDMPFISLLVLRQWDPQNTNRLSDTRILNSNGMSWLWSRDQISLTAKWYLSRTIRIYSLSLSLSSFLSGFSRSLYVIPNLRSSASQFFITVNWDIHEWINKKKLNYINKIITNMKILKLWKYILKNNKSKSN